MTLLALPWLFYSYYILAIDFGGSNCRDPDLTNCGDSATQFYGWGQASLTAVGLALLGRAIFLTWRERQSGRNGVEAPKAALAPVLAACLWLVLVAIRSVTAGQVY